MPKLRVGEESGVRIVYENIRVLFGQIRATDVMGLSEAHQNGARDR